MIPRLEIHKNSSHITKHIDNFNYFILLFFSHRFQTLELVTKFDTGKKRINCLARALENMWLGCQDCIQIRNERTGDLVNAINGICTCTMAALPNCVWVSGDRQILIFDAVVR
jgi:hypothetical protein